MSQQQCSRCMLTIYWPLCWKQASFIFDDFMVIVYEISLEHFPVDGLSWHQTNQAGCLILSTNKKIMFVCHNVLKDILNAFNTNEVFHQRNVFHLEITGSISATQSAVKGDFYLVFPWNSVKKQFRKSSEILKCFPGIFIFLSLDNTCWFCLFNTNSITDHMNL